MLVALWLACGAEGALAAPAWDHDKARDYAALAYAAACRGPDILERFSCSWCRKAKLRGFEPDKYVTHEATKGAALTGYERTSNQIFLVYRSTVLTEWRSVMVDFTFDKVDAVDARGTKHGQVHRGFRDAWVGLESSGVEASLNALMQAHPTAELVFVGHSLGGALATFAAAQVSSRTGKPVLLYTYGSPRLGDRQYGDWFATLPITYYRHVTADDPVPHAPRLLQGYVHVASGQELWFEDLAARKPRVCPRGENDQCANTVKLATNFAGAHATYLGHKFDQCGLGPIADIQDWAQSALGKLADTLGDAKDVAVAVPTAAADAASAGADAGRAALQALPGLASLASSAITAEGNALKLALQGAQPPRVYVIRGPSDSWQALVLPASGTAALTPAGLWPQFGARVFGDGALVPQAVVVSTKDVSVDVATWPDVMRQGVASLGNTLELRQGSNAFLRLRLGTQGALAQVSSAIGVARDGEVQVRGLVGPELVGKLLEPLGLPAAAPSGPTRYALSATFPAATPAAFRSTRPQFALEFPATRVEVQGRADAISLSGTQSLDLYVLGQKTSFTNTLTFTQEAERYTISCRATAQTNPNVLGTQALGFAVRSLSVGGELSVSAPKQGKAAVDGLGLTFGVDFANGMQGDFAALMADTKLTELSVALKTKQPMLLSSLAPFKALPGAGEFSFVEVALGVSPADHSAYVFGELDWRSIRWTAAVVAGAGRAGRKGAMPTALFLRASGLKLQKLNPQIPAAVDVIPLDDVLVVVSSDKVEGVSPASLPSRIEAMVASIAGATKAKLTFTDGLTLVTSYQPDPTLKQPLSVLGLGDARMIVAGQVGGVFGGDPSLGLYADLGRFELPASARPGFVRVDDVSPEFFLLGRELKRAPALDLGLELSVGMRIGPDELAMALQAYATFGQTGSGVTAKGMMRGTWNNPLGLQNMAIADTVVGFGIDGNPSATLTVTLGGTMRFADLSFTTGGVLGLATALPAPGTPTKVGLSFEGTELGLLTQLALMDTFVRSAATGPLAQAITDPKLGAALSALARSKPLAQHAAESTPLELVKLQGVHVFMATPGATDPALPGIRGLGVGAKGRLSVAGVDVGMVDSYATAEDGLKVAADLKDFALGPLLSLKGAKLDVSVPPPTAGLPSFKLTGNATVLIATSKLDIEASKEKLKFVSKNDWGALGQAEIRAESLGGSLLKPTDFVLAFEANADMRAALRKQLVPALKTVAAAATVEANKALTTARADLKDLEANTAKERANAARSQETAASALSAAKKDVSRARGVVSDLKEDIRSKKNALEKAEDEWKWDKAAKYGIELGWLYTKLEGAKVGLRIARDTLEALDDVTTSVPVDLMPNVVVALAAENQKRTEVEALEVAKEASGELGTLASAVGAAAGAVPITVEELSLRDGRLSAAMRGEPQRLRVRVKISTDPQRPLVFDEELQVNLMNPTGMDLRPLAEAVTGMFQTRKARQKRATKLRNTPRAELSAGVLGVGQQKWGDWRPMADCPPGTWAIGFEQRVEPPNAKGEDDTALNSVRLVCASEDRGAPTVTVSSHEGWWGSWASSPTCAPGQWLEQGRIRIEARQGGDKDDTAANDVQFKCSDGAELSAGNGTSWGSWLEYQACPEETVMCGVSIRLEEKKGSDKDDTAMNGLRVRCCELPQDE